VNDVAAPDADSRPADQNGREVLAATIADRLNALVAKTTVTDNATGRTYPLTIPQLVGFADQRFEGVPVPFSARHLYRISRGETYPRIDTLWLLAELLRVHPVYFLGGNLPTPKRYPSVAAAPPNVITRGLARTLSRYITTTDGRDKMPVQELVRRIEEQDQGAAISVRQLARLLKGTGTPPMLDTLAAIAAAVGVDLVDLIAGPGVAN
jgi:transcriptional regulator with XRE-family HTH domain